jgi:hypothetical protein
MRNAKLILLVTLSLVVTASCKKEFSVKEGNADTELDKTKIYKLPATPEEKLLVQNLAKVSNIFKELYKDNANLKLVNAAIFAKAYTDESILLKDLIFPQGSRLNSNSNFKKLSKQYHVSLGQFSDNFWGVVNKQNDPGFKQFLTWLNVDNQANNLSTKDFNESGELVSIYFPYSEEFAPSNDGSVVNYAPISSIITATADADEGLGELPVYSNGVLQFYKQVLINDAYVESNPTHIIGLNGIEPYFEPATIMEAFPPSGPILTPGLTREVKQVFVGDVKCKKQYDHLISFSGNGGGSEIRFTRADGFLKVADGQVQADAFFVGDGITIRRSKISDEVWINFAREWDGDWEESNLQQNLAIYEEDNRNTSTFSGNLKTTLTFKPEGSPVSTASEGGISFSINFKSDDAIIKQTNYNRDVFFILNRTDLEGEMINGWPVRDRFANVSFTLNDRSLVP